MNGGSNNCLAGLWAGGSEVMGGAGLVFGPSAGHWYAGDGMTTGLGMRFAAAGGIATLIVADPHGSRVSTWFGLIGALGLWETGVAWDLVTLPRAVHRANRARLVPVITGNGLAIAGAF